MTQQAFRLNIDSAQVSTEVSAPHARNGVDAHDAPSRCGGHGCTIGDTPCGVVHLFRVAPRLLTQLGRRGLLEMALRALALASACCV
jgi:hypothetical protein